MIDDNDWHYEEFGVRVKHLARLDNMKSRWDDMILCENSTEVAACSPWDFEDLQRHFW